MVPVPPTMSFQRMSHHLILSWKRPIASILTAIATVHGTPKHSFLHSVGTVVVSIKIVPAAEISPATPWNHASENERTGIVRSIDCANVAAR
jgi:hypothetical protein